LPSRWTTGRLVELMEDFQIGGGKNVHLVIFDLMIPIGFWSFPQAAAA
jgi:hypothetical protein